MTDSPPPAPTNTGQQVAAMTVEEFQDFVRVLANQCWVRYYLHLIPGSMVLEVVTPQDDGSLERLNDDLLAQGFGKCLELKHQGWLLNRWAVKRDYGATP